MKKRWPWLCLFVGLLLIVGYFWLAPQPTKFQSQVLRQAPPIAEFEMPPTAAPRTPFRVVWQQINLEGAVVSHDWKFLAKTHGASTKGASTSLVSLQSEKFEERIPGTPFPQKSPDGPSDIVFRLQISDQVRRSVKVEAISGEAMLAAIHGFKSQVFSLTDGRELWSLQAPQYGPRVFLGFSPNGQWLLTREGDKYGRDEKYFLREARTGKILRRFDWPSSPYEPPLGFSPDSRQFGVFDRGVKFYAMPSGKLTFRYDGFAFGASRIEFSRDAQTLITSDSGDETVATWNPKTGRRTRSWPARYNAGGALKMSPDGKFLASGSDGSCGRDLVRVWDFDAVREIWVAPSGYNSWGMSDVAWSPDGTLLASASANGPPQIWNARTGQRIAVLGGKVMSKGTQASYFDTEIQHSEPTLFWSSDARELWVGGKEGLKVWSRDGEFLREITVVKNIVSMARCPSGQRIAIGAGDGRIALLRVKDETILWSEKVSEKPSFVSFLPSNQIVSWSASDETNSKILVWDAKGGFTTQTLDAVLGVYRVVVSRDGTHLVSSGKDGLMLWETAPE